MLKSKDTKVVVVLPCLNEEANLKVTCQSLGFGVKSNSVASESYLVIVDNGSSDRTLEIADAIKRESFPDTVIIVHESERGYVPPRHRGVLTARELAAHRNWLQDEVIVLQADADTIYFDNYISLMRKAALESGDNCLLEGYTAYPPNFQKQFWDYIKLISDVDRRFEVAFTDSSIDFILDDKVCGYWLPDYFQWGGLRREYTPSGDEIHAETTRMYITAFKSGCKLIRVDDALGYHSVRRIFENPLQDFVTAGYPREKTWKAQFSTYMTLQQFLHRAALAPQPIEIKQLIEMRERHLLALFVILPLHILNTIGQSTQHEGLAHINSVIKSGLPIRSLEDVRRSPGKLLMDVLLFSDNIELATLSKLIGLL